MFKGIRYLWKIMWRIEKKYIIKLQFREFINNICIYIPIIMSNILISSLLLGDKQITICWMLLFVIGLFLCKAIYIRINQSCLNTRSEAFNKFQIYISDKMSRIKYERLEASDFLEEREEMYKFFYSNGQGFGISLELISGFMGNIITIILAVITLKKINFIFLILIFILTIINVIFNNFIKTKIYQNQIDMIPAERKSTYFLDLFTDYTFNREVRANNVIDWVKNKYKEQLASILEYMKKNIRYSSKISLFSNTIQVIQNIVVYTVMIDKVISGYITIGEFSMYVSTIILLGNTINSVFEKLIEISKLSMYKDAAQIFLDEKEERYGQLKIDGFIESIEFCNVTFKYPNTERAALNNVSCKLYAKTRISVVGENGAGKSTFIKLLLRLYEPTEGTILVNNIDIKKLELLDYRKKIATVFQDFVLFSFSIKDNICFDNCYDKNKIERYMDEQYFNLNISNLPRGIDTIIYKIFDNDGYVPSGGDAQKIALIRALYYDNAEVLILDEPTAALDPKAEYELYKQFDVLSKGKMSIYISHRLSSCKFADKILVFKEGYLYEEGNHIELLNNNNEYAKLFKMQADMYT